MACDVTSKDNVLDLHTAAEPQAWWARDLTLEFGVFSGQTLADVSDIQSVSIYLKDTSNLEGAPLAAKVVTAFDNSTTGATWADGTRQHFTATFAADELSFALGSNSQRLVHMAVIAVTSAGATGTICVGRVNVIDDGGNSPGTVPVNALTLGQGDARYTRFVTPPANGADFSMFPGSTPPGSGVYLADDGNNLWILKGGQAAWRKALIGQ